MRGDAGVGKSVVLKHFAEQVSAESRIIVLSPNRTIARGWTVMRSVLRFDGTAHELLADLAASGGGTLFIDSLDSYGVEERLTVIDLVLEAARVPGIFVIATARRDFGVAELVAFGCAGCVGTRGADHSWGAERRRDGRVA
jgi:hypothetical protein